MEDLPRVAGMIFLTENSRKFIRKIPDPWPKFSLENALSTLLGLLPYTVAARASSQDGSFTKKLGHQTMDFCPHGLMVTWSHGLMVTWSHGHMVTWSHGHTVTLSHGHMDT